MRAQEVPATGRAASLTPLSPEVSGPAGTGQLLMGGDPAGGVQALPATCSKTGESARTRLEPLSPSRLRVEFTARVGLYEKLEIVRELLSRVLPGGAQESHIEAKIRARTQAAGAGTTAMPPGETPPLEAPAKVLSSLCSMGFRRSDASGAIGQALGSESGLDVEQLLQKCCSRSYRKQAESSARPVGRTSHRRQRSRRRPRS